MPPHSEQIVSRICGALFRGSQGVDVDCLPSTPSTGYAVGDALRSSRNCHGCALWQIEKQHFGGSHIRGHPDWFGRHIEDIHKITKHRGAGH
ncbi:hypothetical protein BRL93_25010 [Xanthomonas oryzae pv. oryzae]|nr:hypothetical protein BRL93_25010 [Xanthomonas oryzae pv. oryzae]